MAKKNGSGVVRRSGTYAAYVFRGQDPAVAEFTRLAADHFGHNVGGKDFTSISEAGGPASSTMRNWASGKTMSPRNVTIEAAGRAMGYHRVWQRMRKNT